MTKNLKRGELKERIGCWFCLENPEADRDLVAFEGKDYYLALDKGPIDDYHMLLIPQLHLGSSLNLLDEGHEIYSKLGQYDDKLMKFFESEGRSVIRSERFINLSSNINHMLINYVSFPKFQFEAVMGLFQIFVKQTGMKFMELQDEDNWTDFVGRLEKEKDPKAKEKNEPYFIHLEFWDVYNLKKKRFLATMSEELVRSLPRNFVREFLCQILDKNDRIDWKSCKRSEDK